MKKAKSNQESDGSIPIPVLNQINEHTIGGFIIFYFNSETGRPEQIMSFDSPAHSLAMQKHIDDWQEAVRQYTLNNNIEAIERNMDSPEE